MRASDVIAAARSRLRELSLLRTTLTHLVAGFARLRVDGPCVTVFGSARTAESHHYYATGREIGRRLSEAGFTVMTGPLLHFLDRMAAAQMIDLADLALVRPSWRAA